MSMKETVAESMGKFVYNLSYEKLPEEIIEKLETMKTKIISGEIKVPNTIEEAKK